MTENEISTSVIGCAIKVHKALGPGLLDLPMKNVYFMKLRRLV
jgi:hypothetical protein